MRTDSDFNKHFVGVRTLKKEIRKMEQRID
jgi:hypothetical protein